MNPIVQTAEWQDDGDSEPKIDSFLNRIHVGDCLQTIAKLPEDSIDLVVTSPPYDNLRDYKGFKLNLFELGRKLYKVVKPGGVVVMVMQDATNLCKTLTTFKTIFGWSMNGWKLFECCIYRKHGAEGAWWSKRFRVDHEYIPIFVKGDRPAYFDKEGLKVPCKHAGKTIVGCATRKTDGTTEKSKPVVINPTKCRGTVWDYTTSGDGPRLKHQHPATFPDQLPYDGIQCFCPPDGVVLDPFMGSGTTARAAIRLGRNWIGCEISEEYSKEVAEPLIKEEIEKRDRVAGNEPPRST
jgi:site-specific DNA-methyltransferase (adenine-specific)